jgi:hypothetical protein
MATYAAFAIGPIAFFDVTTGKHISIPLTDIVFNGSTPSLSAAPPGVSAQVWSGPVTAWIKYLASVGAIVPTTTVATAVTNPVQ